MWIEEYFENEHRRELLFKLVWVVSWGMLVFGCIMIAVLWNG